MSIYDFFPMKKRKICKTPSGPATRRRSRTSASTLGKLKRSLDGSVPGDNDVEILWDNNSPSPTTTIALAGKRRRRQNGTQGEETGVTDLSFVVQKFSENTSPVVSHGHSALLDMWCNKPDQQDNNHVGKEEFTSPPFQTRHQRSPLIATPLNKRRISNRTSRKVTRQFMLEIRKLVDEIQKSDLSSCSTQSQKECKIEGHGREERCKKNAESFTKVTTQIKPSEESCTKVTQIKPSVVRNVKEPCDANTSEPGTTKSDRLLEDSFEWSDDDMDELILTCQLSSSGKGSLTVPVPPRPQFGSSPSQTFVPETQILFQASRDVTQLNTNAESEHAQEVPVDNWEMDFDGDDSLLASVVQEFEQSQEAMPTCKKTENDCKNNGESVVSFEKPLKTCPLSTTRSDVSESSNKRFSNQQNESLIESSQAKKSDPKIIAGKISDVSKPFLMTKQTNSRNSSEKANATRQSNKNTSVDRLAGKKDDAKTKEVAGKMSDLNKQFGKQPPATNWRNLSEKANDAGQYSTNVLTGKKITGGKPAVVQAKSISVPQKGNVGRQCMTGSNVNTAATPSQRTKLSLRRSTPAGTKPSASYANPARSNENHARNSENHARNNENHARNNARAQVPRANDGSSSPLRSTPGNLRAYPEKPSRPPSSEVHPFRGTSAFAKETVGEIFGGSGNKVKECKSSVVRTKTDQSNEYDFLLCEENFAALLEEFNFDEVLTKAPTQAPAKTTNNFNKSCGNNSAPPMSEKKTTYSKDEIERKRVEAQRRRLAKQKNTVRNNSRISKR